MWCLRVMPALFLRDMYRALSVPRSQPPPRTPHYSPMLHNAILSISAVFSDDPYIREPQTRKIFAKAAKAWLETDCEKPGISLVPALAFLGSYHADAGMSTKVSIDLGLAVDCTIFAMDVAWATLVFRETASLFAIGRKVIDIQNNLATARQDLRKVDEDITNIDLELHNWKSRLPDHLDITLANRARSTPQRLMLHCQYYWTFIVLHRPFFNRRSIPTQVHLDGKIDHVKLCLRAAENILEILETWSSVYTLGFSPMPLAQIMFSAGTVFLLRALQSTASPRIAHGALNTALAQVEQCIHYLREMGHRFRSATRIALNLHALLNDKLRPIVARRIAQKGYTNDVRTAAHRPRRRRRPPSDGEKLTTELTSAYTPAYDSSHLLPNSIPVYPMDWSSNSPHASPPPPQAWAQQNQTPTAWDYIPQHGENTSPEQSAMYQPGGEDAYPALDPDMSAFMGLPGFDRVWAQDSLPNPRPPFGFPPPPGQYLSHR
ncbi:hypothetical protein C8R46DRAFT_1212789 [Mycena filopes]|nr:hypothetical protein C8R46DRAFT_1212789 [Mycena filopes]